MVALPAAVVTNPAVSRKGFRDADGDGVTSAEMGCFAALPDGCRTLRTTTNDCDDTSAALQSIADADADGYGARRAPRAARPPQAARGSRALTPTATTATRRSALSASSNGTTAWIRIATGTTRRSLARERTASVAAELLGTKSVPVDPSCASADLFVVAYRTCQGCFGYDAVIVGNRGTVAFSGGFDVGGLPNEPAFHVAEDLAPGAASRPFLVGGGAPSIVVTTPALQCHVQNDQAASPSPAGICDP